NTLSFSGSINETAAGWISHRENFHVHLSWGGGRDLQHVHDEGRAFENLWKGRAWSVRVLDFPEAAKAQLLEFLPRDDRFIAPPRLPRRKPPDPSPEPVPQPHLLMPDEIRRAVWTYIRNAGRAWN